jgi:hypothetical protein
MRTLRPRALNNGELEALETVDLAAVSPAQAWGFTNGHVLRVPPSPCSREECGGSVLVWMGSGDVFSATAP